MAEQAPRENAPRESLPRENVPREKLRRRVRAGAFAGLARVAGLFPHACVRAALVGASPLARFARTEARTRANLALAFGDELDARARAHIARGVRHHAARLAASWLRLAHAGDPASPASAWIDAEVVLDPSFAILERERARGRGVIVVTGHFGDWELLCARLIRLGFSGAVVGFERPNDSGHRWLERMRAGYGVQTLPQHTPAREILRLLRRGETLGLVCDLEVRRLDGEFVPFFGRPALTMTAPAALARAAELPLVPVSCVFEDGRYVLRAEAPLALDPTLDKHAAQRDLLTRLNATFERWIRAHPEQWAWHQHRWRTQPGEIELLPLDEQRRRERARRIAAGKPVAPER